MAGDMPISSILKLNPGAVGVWKSAELAGSVAFSGVPGRLRDAIGGESFIKSSMVSLSTAGCSFLTSVPLTLLRVWGSMLFLRLAPPRGIIELSTA